MVKNNHLAEVEEKFFMKVFSMMKIIPQQENLNFFGQNLTLYELQHTTRAN